MHTFKKIIAYFVVTVIAFSLGMYSEKLINSFYPHRNAVLEPINAIGEQEEVTTALQNEEIVTADTKLITIEYDLKTKTQVASESNIPIKYIGLNREEFIEEMEVYEMSPALPDIRKGFHSLSVNSFSRQQIEIQKNYLQNETKMHYYIVSKDNKLVVYYDDLETVYITTEIRTDSLPEKVQLEILQMKYFETEEELYNFLESYSS